MFSALACSLDNNQLTNEGNDMSGILKLAEALPHSQLTSLRWPTSPSNFAWTLCLCLPLRQQPLTGPFLLLSFCCRSLRDNYMGAKGGAAIAEGLKGNTTLRSLE